MPYLGNEVAPLVQALEGKELKLDSDGDSSITADTDDRVDVKVGGSDIAHVTSTGLGIGTTSPSSTLELNSSSGNSARLKVGRSTSHTNYLELGTDGGESTIRATGASSTNGSLIFQRNDGSSTSESMRLNSTGVLLVNKTSQDGAEKLSLNFDRTSQQGISINNTSSTAPNNATMIEFRYAGTTNGSIGSNGSSTSYNTSSDHRLKENIVTDWDATTRLKQLKPSRFNFKADKDTTVDGFLAHEVSSIIPEAISGEKDAVDADGNPEYQGIDQSKLVPLLTKALQEAVAKIETLEAKVTALESK